MRIHQLSIQAFGPFAGTEEIDFDDLGTAGLFLLDGPTGAGKSSILDAICYAIYGSLPGNRQGSRQIRSDHAAEGLNPEVRLELSIGERRFELTRSPAWMRPAKRGKNKFTEEKAKSSLRELVAGQWQALSTRNDEVGQMMGSVLGLDREQFTKVVMLPQGGFADFLRAKDSEREKLLSRLFDTSDYAKIEEEFATRLTISRKNTEAIEAELAALANHIREDAEQSLRHEGIEPAGGHEGEEYFAELEEQLLTAATANQEAFLERKKGYGAANQKHSSLANRQRVFARLSELEQLRKEHESSAERAAGVSAALILDQQARRIRPYFEQLAEAQKRVVELEIAATQAVSALQENEPRPALSLDQPTLVALTEERDQLTGQLSVLRAALPEEHSRAALAKQHQELELRVEKENSTASNAQSQMEQFAAERTNLLTQDLDAVAAATAVLQAQQQLEASETAVEQVKQRETAEQKLDTAKDQRREAAKVLDEQQNTYLQAQRQLMEQAAVRLAAALEPGEPCLVCGATEHPQLATAEAGAQLVDEEHLQMLEEQLEAQRGVVSQHELKIESLRTTHQALVEQVGSLSLRESAEKLAEARDQLQQAKDQQQQISTRVARVETLETQIQDMQAKISAAQLAATTASEQCAAAGEQLRQLDERLAQLRGDYPSLTERTKSLEHTHRLVQQTQQALERLLDAQQSRIVAQQRWDSECEQAGFESTQGYQDALLPAATRTEYEKLYKARQERATTITTLSESADIAEARKFEEQGLSTPTEDELERLRAELSEAEQLQEAARQAEVVARSALQRLREGRQRLENRITQAGPVIEDYRRLKALAEVMRGGGENRLKMTLSTYVLAARLEEVTAAATERLQVMSSQRYSLHHDDSARGNAKSGLGIRVHDAWTGRDRETQTLSGGETFMASLSLALGLADVITHHSGAVDMQTLFVDEGFGSLDTETLELVMESLESLRSGGRVIGVVSHVSEMKQRITNRLTVEKTREGSTIHTIDAEVSLALSGQL